MDDRSEVKAVGVNNPHHSFFLNINNTKSKIMNISQALKEKNKKAQNLAKLIAKCTGNNVAEDGVAKDYSSKKVLEEAQVELTALVDLKTKIHAASAPVRSKIFRLSELKGLSKALTYMNTSESVVRNRTTGDIVSTNKPEITTKEHEIIIKAIGDEIDAIQEQLDAFNHTTSI